MTRFFQRLLMFARLCSTGAVIRNSTRIAAVVGTVLNLINQHEQLFGGGKISWGHFVLNYVVPFVVASYSAGTNEYQRRIAEDEP
jgi:hypothetical protein